MPPPLFSIVIPVFNSEKSLEELCRRIHSVFQAQETDYEILLIDDGSSDQSWLVMKKIRYENPQIKIIRLRRNFGQANAIMCGFQYSSGDWILTMDDDLQHPPEEIPKMIAAVQNLKTDVVFGVPRGKKHSVLKNIGSYGYRKLIHFLFKSHPQIKVSSFRLIQRTVVEQIIQDKTPNPLITPMIFDITRRVGAVEIEHKPRIYGRTTYTISKLIRQFLHGVLYYSTLPLKAIFYMGILSVLLSIVLALYYLYQYLADNIIIPGWTTLVLLILFFSGAIMFSMGIIGEYLLRIAQEVHRTPQYVIHEKEI